MTRFSKFLQSAVDIPVLATSALGMALLAIGIGFFTPTGEQSKLQYPPDLWCVSNFIEQRPQVILPDGRPRQDKLLDGKEEWIVRDQIKADSKEEAEKKARSNGKGRFEPSNQDELRAKIQANNKDFFTSHFNTGATIAGPCWGTGSTGSQTGRWLNDALREDCFGISQPTALSGQYEVVKTLQVTITPYSPNMPVNTCDAATGGPAVTTDGGAFKEINGRIRYVKGSQIADYVFAEPTTNNIIPWNQINQLAVVLPGFNNDLPIRIADHYAPGLHANQNYLDLFAPCGEYSHLPTGKQTVQIVDLSKPISQVTDQSDTSPSSAAKLSNAPSNCPETAPSAGPSEGEDYRAQIAQQFEQQLSQLAAQNAGSCEIDTSSEEAIVNEAMKYAPGADGKTKYKYSKENGDGPNTFDCSGFVHYVLKKVKSAGADVSVGSGSLTSIYKNVGQVIDKIDPAKFVTSSGGSKLRSKSDMPQLSDLQPGDILFFGTSTSSGTSLEKDPNTIGHMGIYLGNGKFIHSTSSDKDLNKDSASKGNNTSSPPFSAHSQGAQYADYNGVKIDSLYNSYFTPGLYMQVNRVAKKKDCGGAYGGVYGTVAGLGTTAYPGGEGASPSFGTCHGSSACHPAEKYHHGIYQNRGSGDALDISPRDGIARAVFDGTATHGGSGRDSYTLVTSANGQVQAYYYHTINLKNGAVKAGDAVAKVGAGGVNHIHFELLINGRSVNGNQNLRSSESAYQASLWKNMKIVLGLP